MILKFSNRVIFHKQGKEVQQITAKLYTTTYINHMLYNYTNSDSMCRCKCM